VWCGQQISLGSAQPLLPGSCLRNCEYVPGSCRRTGLHTPVILVPPCPVSARPICNNRLAVRDTTSATCSSLPKFQGGTCPKGFASFALFQTLLLQEGLTDTTSLRSSLPGSLKKQHDRTYLRLAVTWKITGPVQPADERHGGIDRSRIQERSRSQLS
jgi:hypothetical protein